jgi:transcriptional regulator with XRE-family HTH domain
MLGEKLRQARRRHGLSQDQLADLAGVPQPVISRLETGKECNPTIDVARRLARVLGIGIDHLAGTFEFEDEDKAPVAAGTAAKG